MKRRALKISAFTFILVLAVVMCASCDMLYSSLGMFRCQHTDVSYGNCKEYPHCLSCGEILGDSYGDHDYGEAKVIDPGCLEGGSTEIVCSVCNDRRVLGTTEALGHNFGEWELTKEPSADSVGEMSRICSRCELVEKDDVPPHEHTLESREAKAATCTEDGWGVYEYCTQCVYNNRTLIGALGHAYGAYSPNGNGTHTRTCANDASHVKTEPCTGGDYSGGTLPICELCNTAYEFAARPGNSTYGYYALGEYSSGEKMQALYKALTARAEEFYNSDENVNPKGENYVIGEFDINDYSLTLEEAAAVWKIFYISNPAYYWLDSTIITHGDVVLLLISDLYAAASVRRECDAAVEQMTLDCALLINDDMSELERAMEITAFIVKEMEYAYESDGKTPVDDMWAHNMIGLAMYGKGVCESYAKSFMYLCLLNGVDCVMGSGYAGGEAHAWNYVRLDGEWYGADITWTDKMGDEAVYDNFGLSGSSILSDHTPHSSTDFGVKFIYEAPELATRDIELTSLYKDGDKVGIYKSIDEAFAAMTDTEAEYEIYIGYYSYYEGALMHTLSAESTPSVKKLTIRGRSEYIGEKYLDNNSIIYFRSSLTLNCDVEICDVRILIYDGIGACSINLGKNSLTLGGSSAYIDTRVEGTDAESCVTVSAERGAYFNAGFNIYRLIITSDKAVIGANSHAVYASTENLYGQNGAKMEIDNYT